MKKKILSILISVFAICTFMFTLSACGGGEPPHTHVYDQQVVNDTFKASNATCEDKATYFYSCSCGEGGLETFEVGEALGHAYSNWASNGNNTHSKTCANDNTHIITEDCSGGAPTETQRPVCKDCHTEYGESLGHIHTLHLTKVNAKPQSCTKEGNIKYYTCSCGKWFADNTTETEIIDKTSVVIAKDSHKHSILKYNETEHWWECSCGDKATAGGHIPGAEATEITDQKCTVCEHVITPALGHVHTLHLTKVDAKPQSCTQEGNKEYYTCSCGKWFTDNTATTEITDKSSVVIEKDAHKYETLKKTATQHWYECTCGAYETKENHIPGAEATEITDQKCTVCEHVITPALGHVHTLHLTKVNAKPQSCTKEGNIKYYTCSCGKWFADNTTETEITDKTSVVIAKDNHKHNILKHNETEHWYECSCGDRATAEEHKGGTATETQRPVCSECGVEYGDFLVELDYEINNDGTYRIIGIGSCEKKEVVIPSSIKGIQVTEIADNAFEGQSQIIALILPETIKHIGTRAFYNCTGLKQFTIPSSVETFGTQIFYKTSIETIYYNNDNSCSENLSLSHIKTVVFGGTKIPKEIKCNVPEIKILDSVAIIEDSAFKSCNAIKKVITGKGLIKIGRHAFALCESLTSLILCGGALTIEEEAFFGCTALTEINFNVSRCFDFSNNNYIFGKAGIEGSGIKVIIGTDVFRVPANLFYPGSQNAYGSYEAKIKEVVFEEGSICKSIGYSAFEYCNQIESLKLSNNISTIESYAFLGCTSLKIVQLSEKLTNIGNYAFNGCSLEYIKIPDMVTRIEDSAFRGCSFLKEIEIADSVVYIGDNAFLKCESIEKIYYKGDETGWNYISVGNNIEQISMVKVLYYIENQEDVPTDGGNYWHYDEKGNPIIW